MSSNPEQTFDEAPSEFLRSLVNAMRRVVEATRDQTLAEMRAAVDSEATQLDLSRSAREKALRERAQAEIAGVGAWERAEIERIRAEALRKVQARGGQLDQELAELAATNTADHAALAARADAYEREVSEFMAELEAIDDPAAFAVAARRMPQPWATRLPGGAPAARAIPAPATDAFPTEPMSAPMAAPTAPRPQPVEAPARAAVAASSEAERAATAMAEASPTTSPTAATPEPAAPATEAAAPVEPAVADEATEVAEASDAVQAPAAPPAGDSAMPHSEPAVEVEKAPGQADEEPDQPTAAAAEAGEAAEASPDVAETPAEPSAAPEAPGVPDQSTAIQVHGLGSFGAITSFKQSLERVDGIRSVTLGLGPTGEFVYTATHSPSFDLSHAIRAIQGAGVEIEQDNGTLRVRVAKAG